MVMIKPGLPYLDIGSASRTASNATFVYQVSASTR